eukprot:CAMPEP_0204193580 /NCGR_PEP_ID=MMETSP0361-20130328/61760_1 /ASSEMBLY_ACC=CAM_ASM_000343 /TAXON_ID=268821 /ORGANISM="Scrippsiella Hangoei, Strain SHTV-5" /LENGTH=82 /DNA_ID=CAMNT_0051154819 /DNA_START=397 /DNA_END=646 /DNA_ORIENTATION=+
MAHLAGSARQSGPRHPRGRETAPRARLDASARASPAARLPTPETEQVAADVSDLAYELVQAAEDPHQQPLPAHRDAAAADGL